MVCRPWGRKESDITGTLSTSLLYRVVLASAIEWDEPATYVHVSRPSWASPRPPSHPSRSPESMS